MEGSVCFFTLRGGLTSIPGALAAKEVGLTLFILQVI